MQYRHWCGRLRPDREVCGVKARHTRRPIGWIVRRWAVIALFVLSGCAPSGIAPEQLSNVKTIGIVSAIGDRFAFQMVGVTILGNDRKDWSIETWQIDEHVTNVLAGHLARRFDVRPVTFRPAAFISERKGEPTTQAGALALGNSVRAAVQPKGLDAYVVVTKARAPVGATGQVVEGVGLQRYSLSSITNLHVLYSITVVDGRTYQVIGSTPAFSAAESRSIGGPSQKVDPALWTEMLAAPNQDLRGQAHGMVLNLLNRSLPATLADLKLVDRGGPGGVARP